MIRLVILLLVVCSPWCCILAGDLPRMLLSGTQEYELAPHGHGNIYAPSLLLEEGRWRLWYGGQGKDGHDRICYAESTNGVHWKRFGVVLEDESANHINDPCVIKVGKTYFMYYTRAEKFVIDRIYVAKSTDGISWRHHKIALDVGPKSSWDAISVGRPSVIYEEGVFKMWYDGRKDFPSGAPVEDVPTSSDSHRYVGYATSTDGLNWHRHGDDPVFENNAGGIDVKRLKDNYLMLYESHGGTRYAKSKDGIQWNDAGWLIQKSGEELDRHGHVTPFLLVDKTAQTWLVFGAAKAATWNQNSIAILPVLLKNLK